MGTITCWAIQGNLTRNPLNMVGISDMALAGIGISDQKKEKFKAKKIFADFGGVNFLLKRGLWRGFLTYFCQKGIGDFDTVLTMSSLDTQGNLTKIFPCVRNPFDGPRSPPGDS